MAIEVWGRREGMRRTGRGRGEGAKGMGTEVGGEAYRRNGDGCEGKWVANYVAHVDAATAVLPRVLHFAQRRGME